MNEQNESMENVMKNEVKIAVLKDAWVLVGRCERRAERLVITNASVIRVWGTTNGLGEIAVHGPTDETKLDPLGVVEVEYHDLKFMIDCTQNKWDG